MLEIIEAFFAATTPPINIVEIVIKNGNLPLHGTKAFVSIEISFSRGESIILQPVTPQLLQPNPIHIVNACFPELPAFLKNLSKLNAIRGKNPKSSNNVNNGKNIAIGGSITAIIHVSVLYIPSITTPFNHIGTCKYSNASTNISCKLLKILNNHSDG